MQGASLCENQNLSFLTKPNVWILLSDVHALWLTKIQQINIFGQERNNKHF